MKFYIEVNWAVLYAICRTHRLTQARIAEITGLNDQMLSYWSATNGNKRMPKLKEAHIVLQCMVDEGVPYQEIERCFIYA